MSERCIWTGWLGYRPSNGPESKQRVMNQLSRFASLLRDHTGEGRKSAFVQIVELTSLLMRGHVHPSEYFRYEFSSQDVTKKEIARYLGNHTYWHEVRPKLTDASWRLVLANKWFFHQHYRNFVPLPETFGYYHAQYGMTCRGGTLRSHEDVERMILRESISALVVKPVLGWKGEDVRVMNVVEEEGGVTLVTADGTSMSVSRLVDRLDEGGTGGETGWIVQERLRQDHVMDRIAAHGTHTIRVVTIVDGEGEVHIPSAAVKMGGPRSWIDNVATGGVAALIDVDTGIVGEAYSNRNRARDLRRQPGADREFTGQEIPRWSRVRRTAERAARNTPGVLAVGWDIILSAGDVFVIEGNDDWDVLGPQTGRPGLLQEPIAAILRDNGVAVSGTELPPIRVRKALGVLGFG